MKKGEKERKAKEELFYSGMEGGWGGRGRPVCGSSAFPPPQLADTLSDNGFLTDGSSSEKGPSCVQSRKPVLFSLLLGQVSGEKRRGRQLTVLAVQFNASRPPTQ